MNIECICRKIISAFPHTVAMAPKNRNTRDTTPSVVAHTQSSTTSAGSVSGTPAKVASAKPTSKSASNNQSPQEIALGIWQNYLDTTPQRTKLIDIFMTFLVVVGILQFVYCILNGNFVSSPILLTGGLSQS